MGLCKSGRSFDLLFVDPPYRMLAEVEVTLASMPPALLSNQGVMVDSRAHGQRRFAWGYRPSSRESTVTPRSPWYEQAGVTVEDGSMPRHL